MTAVSQKKAKTRNALLDIAATMIKDAGLAHFTLRGLARQKGWSAPSLYEYFKSVEDIIVALRVREEENLYVSLSEAGGATDDAVDTIREFITVYIQFFEGRRDRFEIMFEASKTARSSADAPLPERSSYALLVDAMRRLCVEQACMPDCAEEWAFTAWSYAHGVCALRASYLSPLAQDIEPLAARGVEIVVAGIKAQSPHS